MLAFLLAAMAASVPDDTVTAGALERATPAELAARLLPPADAARVVGGRIRAELFMVGYDVAVWERSVPVAPIICRRPVHTRLYFDQTSLGRRGDPNLMLISISGTNSFDTYGTTYPDRATPEHCATLSNYVGSPPDLAEPTIRALTRLTDAMRSAAAPNPLPFALRCLSENEERPCTNERSQLASLSLSELWGVSFERSYYGLRDASPLRAGEEPVPTMQFGMSAPDGRSWFVTLVGDRERLSAVVMRRTMVIYH
ncbi:MAG: hypothetical protein JO276_05985 [Sphingomonadaceae bacterium]|nr:hypothetical protein [Sphingomonadaceae bacterium]